MGVDQIEETVPFGRADIGTIKQRIKRYGDQICATGQRGFDGRLHKPCLWGKPICSLRHTNRAAAMQK